MSPGTKDSHIVLNQRILGDHMDWKCPMPTTEDTNYLSYFLCAFSYQTRTAGEGPRICRQASTGFCYIALVFHFGPTQHSKQNHLPFFVCATYPVVFAPGHCALYEPMDTGRNTMVPWWTSWKGV